MNLELLAVLAIWLMLLPMADICRSSAARFSGGRGFNSRPKMSCRTSGSIFRPVVSDSRLRWVCSCSFRRTDILIMRFRKVQPSPFHWPVLIGGIRGYPLNKPHLDGQMLCLQGHGNRVLLHPSEKKIIPGPPLAFLPVPKFLSAFAENRCNPFPGWQRIHHHIIRQLFPEPSGGLAARWIIIQTKMNFSCLPMLL